MAVLTVVLLPRSTDIDVRGRLRTLGHVSSSPTPSGESRRMPLPITRHGAHRRSQASIPVEPGSTATVDTATPPRAPELSPPPPPSNRGESSGRGTVLIMARTSFMSRTKQTPSAESRGVPPPVARLGVHRRSHTSIPVDSASDATTWVVASPLSPVIPPPPPPSNQGKSNGRCTTLIMPSTLSMSRTTPPALLPQSLSPGWFGSDSHASASTVYSRGLSGTCRSHRRAGGEGAKEVRGRGHWLAVTICQMLCKV